MWVDAFRRIAASVFACGSLGYACSWVRGCARLYWHVSVCGCVCVPTPTCERESLWKDWTSNWIESAQNLLKKALPKIIANGMCVRIGMLVCVCVYVCVDVWVSLITNAIAGFAEISTICVTLECRVSRPIIIIKPEVLFCWCWTFAGFSEHELRDTCRFQTLCVQPVRQCESLLHALSSVREVGGWGRDPKKCTGRDWGMGSSTI